MPYYGHPDNDAPEFHLAAEPFNDYCPDCRGWGDPCATCGGTGLVHVAAPIAREKLRALEAALRSLTAASQAADPADRAAETHGASPSLTDESPVPAGGKE